MNKQEFFKKLEGKTLKNEVAKRGGYVSIDEKLGNICELLENKELLIPDFQRLGNQWTDAERAELINTILNGYPMPSIIIGICDKNMYLIDGQQRITSSIIMFELLKLNGFKSSQINLLKNYKISIDIINFETDDKMKEYFKKVNARSGLSAVQKLKAGKTVSADFLEIFNTACDLVAETGKNNLGFLSLVKCLYMKKSTFEKTGLEAKEVKEKNKSGKLIARGLRGLNDFAIFKYGKIEEFVTILLKIDNTETPADYTTSVSSCFNALLKIENIDISNTLENFITSIIPRFFEDKSKDEKVIFCKLPFIYAFYDYIRHSTDEVGSNEISLFLNHFLNAQKNDELQALYNVLVSDYEAGKGNTKDVYTSRYLKIEKVFNAIKSGVITDNTTPIIDDSDIKAMSNAVQFEKKEQ